MPLLEPTTRVSPFDIILSQTENEDRANLEALADGSGLNNDSISTNKLKDGAVTADKVDFSTMLSFDQFLTSGSAARNAISGSTTVFGDTYSFNNPLNKKIKLKVISSVMCQRTSSSGAIRIRIAANGVAFSSATYFESPTWMIQPLLGTLEVDALSTVNLRLFASVVSGATGAIANNNASDLTDASAPRIIGEIIG